MRIKEISIQRYGPLANSVFSDLGNFTLIYGANEAGKSLTVDALAKLFFEKVRDVKIIIEASKDRVDQRPEGYVLLENNGQDLKLPEHGTLFELLGIPPEQCRNIFLVRGSELGLSDERRFFESVTNSLLGVESEKINKVAQELRKIGRLVSPTSSSELSDSANDEKVKSRIQKAQELRAKIVELQKKATEQALESKEKSLVQLLETEALLNNQITDQEKARERERYHKGKLFLEKVINCASALEALRDFTEEEENEWKESEKQIAQIDATIKSLEHEVETLKTKQNEIERQVGVCEKELSEQQQRGPKIEALELACKDYREKWQNFIQVQTEAKTLRHYSYGALLVFILSSSVALFREDWPWTVFAFVAFLFFSGIAIRAWLWVALLHSKVTTRFEQVKQDAAQCEFSIGSAFEDILKDIESYKSSLRSRQNELQKLKTDLGIVKHNLTSKESELSGNRQELAKSQEIVERIRSRSRVAELSRYLEKVNERIRLQNELSQNESALNALWTTSNTDLNSKIQFWQEKIDGIKSFENTALDTQCDEILLRRYKEQHQQCKEEISSIEQSLEEWQRELEELADDVTKVIRDGVTRKCHSLSGLVSLKTELEQFEASINEKAEGARTVIRVLEAIRAEEDRRLVSLFSDVTQASDIFSRITGDRYTRIVYNEGELRVINAAGDEIDSRKLSSGTYDQLYLAIRLALAQKILGGKGFFILDDPFIRSDPTRLKNQLLVLRDLAADGWQFLYFSAKGEVRELFEAEIGTENLKTL